MRRNEEEIYKNLRVLRDQLTSPSDIPQVIVQFEEQRERHIFFTVLLVRYFSKSPISELMEKIDGSFLFIADRVDQVGPNKEATIFQIRLENSNFLRKDGSVNLYRGRKEVVHLLEKGIGPIRDYNGGSMDQQNVALKDFLALGSIDFDPFVLENFFYSIAPFEMQNILPVPLIYEWFLLFSKLFDQESTPKNPSHLISHSNASTWMMAVRVEDPSIKEEIRPILYKGVFAEFNKNGEVYFGCLMRPAVNLESVVRRNLDRLKRKENSKHLKLVLQDIEFNLDPRIAQEDQSYIIGKMLFEGLTRLDGEGKPVLALARMCEVSDDFKRYTFHLRDSKWSDGSPVTAHDFEYSWKKALQGSAIPTPFLYPLFLIKNGKKGKEIGVRALSDKRLEVELETAAPHFLEMTAHWSYSLINRRIDEKDPGWAYSEGNSYVCNGPFRLIQREPIAILEKNPHYWDAPSVKLHKITIIKLEKKENLTNLLHQGRIDIIGRPLCALPRDSFPFKGIEMVSQPLQGVLSLCFNTEKSPFNHPKIRKAFALAIDRSSLKSILPDEFGKISQSILPDRLSLVKETLFEEYDPQKARMMFEQAVDELKITPHSFTFHFCNSMYRESLAVLLKNQWERTFQIEIHLRPNKWSTHFQQLVQGHYDLGLIELHALWSDPLHFLEFFEQKTDSLNIPHWENGPFQTLLQKGRMAPSIYERNEFLKQAELLLAQEMPVFPLYQLCGKHLRSDDLLGVVTSEFFSIDFKSAHKQNINSS
jgi:oligopeptide transport system substrate-binding protein